MKRISPYMLVFPVLVILLAVVYGVHHYIDERINYENNRVWPILTEQFDPKTVAHHPLDSPQLTIATGDYPPYVYMENGNIKGIAYNALVTVLEDMGVDYRIEVRSWARGLHDLNRGMAFAVFPYAVTDERELSYAFSDPFYDISLRKDIFFVSTENKKIKAMPEKLADLKHLKVGGIYGYYYLKTFESLGFSVDLSVTELECLQKLHSGKIDIAIFDPFVAEYLIDKHFQSEAQTFVKTDLTMQAEQAGDYLMLDKDNPNAEAFLSQFNEHLHRLKASGQIQDPEL